MRSEGTVDVSPGLLCWVMQAPGDDAREACFDQGGAAGEGNLRISDGRKVVTASSVRGVSSAERVPSAARSGEAGLSG
jgi:hypothetical protein